MTAQIGSDGNSARMNGGGTRQDAPAWRSCLRPARARACARRGPRCCTRSPAASLLGHVLAAVRGGRRHATRGGGRARTTTAVAAEAQRAMPPARRSSSRRERRGTAHAVLAARAALARGADDVLVDLRRHAADPRRDAGAAARARSPTAPRSRCSGFRPADPTGYGRLITERRRARRDPRGRRRERRPSARSRSAMAG